MAAQSIKDNPLVDCPECDHPALHRVIHAAQVLSRPEPTTYGQQAERNDKKMGKYLLEEKRHEHAQIGEAGRQASGMRPPRPWWRKTDKIDTSLAAMAPEVEIKNGQIVKSEPLSARAERFIMEGK